jgi:prepilin-type N-terminal cleavage/methylation domain-containing protein
MVQNMNYKNKAGFTLIELLVVVLIVGILASIAIPQYFKVVEKARVAEAMALAASVKSSEERYLAKGGSYSSDFTQLDISYPNLSSTAITLKYFSATVTSGTNASTGAPDYQITLTRQTANTSVAPRYGLYQITVNMPLSPIPTIGSCASAGQCDELIS